MLVWAGALSEQSKQSEQSEQSKQSKQSKWHFLTTKWLNFKKPGVKLLVKEMRDERRETIFILDSINQLFHFLEAGIGHQLCILCVIAFIKQLQRDD